MPIIQGLFNDMLPATMQDGGGIGARPQPQIPQMPRPVMTQPEQPMAQQEPSVPQIDLSNLNIDLSNLGIDGLMNVGQTQQPQNPSDFFNQYTEFLSGVQSGNTAGKVNRRDDIYNNFFDQTNYRYQGNPSDFRASVGLSDAFSLYDDPTVQVNSQSFQAASQSLAGAEDPLAVLSDYYGFDITPTVNEGANYKNAKKYGTTEESMAEFQSIIEPILQKSIPYIQATQGLEYTDALEYAYTHDPMVAALYNQYGVDLYRQTKDGSTYIFDPIAGQEIRTLEVKDPKFKDIAPALAGIALSFTGIPAALGGAFGATGATASAIGQGLVSTATAALGGERGSDLLVSGITGAMGGYTKGLGTELSSLNEAAKAADAAGDFAGAAQLASQAADVGAQLKLINTLKNTANFANAVQNENYVGALFSGLNLAGVGVNEWVSEKVNTAFAGQEEILGMNTDDLAVGVTQFAEKLMQGKDPKQALISAVVEYAKAGGSFPDLGIDIDLPDFDSSGFFDAVANSKIVQAIRQLGEDFDYAVLQPAKDFFEQTGSAIDDEFIQPIRESLKDIDIPTPDVDLPDLNLDLPSLDLNLGMPSLNLGAVGGTGGTIGSGVDIGTDISMVDPAELFGYVDYIQQLMGENK